MPVVILSEGTGAPGSCDRDPIMPVGHELVNGVDSVFDRRRARAPHRGRIPMRHTAGEIDVAKRTGPRAKTVAFASMLTAGALVLVASPAAVEADIIGFNNLSGWTYNQADGGTPADLPDANTIHLTTSVRGGRSLESRSIFFDTPQNITEFAASFTYRATDFNASLVGQGIALVLQNSPSGASAVGSGNGSLGYGGITKSATTVLFGDTGPGLTYNGYFTNGTIGSGSNSTSPANAFNFRDLLVTASYSGSVLTVTVDDPTTSPVDYTRNYIVGDLASTIGSPTAYVGFTASTGDGFGNGGSNQYLSNFRFTTNAVPEPASLALLACGLLGLLGYHRGRRAPTS